MPAESPDPTVIHSIAVTTADVVAGLELNLTTDDRAVLRVTPPFSGRMRARLHVIRYGEGARGGSVDETGSNGGDGAGVPAADTGPQPLHVEPDRLLEDPPAYPRPADTEDELRADPDRSYTVERHHEYHAAAVEQWRQAVPGTIREYVTLETPGGPHEVTVRTLRREFG